MSSLTSPQSTVNRLRCNEADPPSGAALLSDVRAQSERPVVIVTPRPVVSPTPDDGPNVVTPVEVPPDNVVTPVEVPPYNPVTTEQVFPLFNEAAVIYELPVITSAGYGLSMTSGKMPVGTSDRFLESLVPQSLIDVVLPPRSPYLEEFGPLFETLHTALISVDTKAAWYGNFAVHVRQGAYKMDWLFRDETNDFYWLSTFKKDQWYRVSYLSGKPDIVQVHFVIDAVPGTTGP
jgi:hypothetical protein